MNLNDNEAQKYLGGGKVAISIGIGVGLVISFLLGFVDGYTNPKACRR